MALKIAQESAVYSAYLLRSSPSAVAMDLVRRVHGVLPLCAVQSESAGMQKAAGMVTVTVTCGGYRKMTATGLVAALQTPRTVQAPGPLSSRRRPPVAAGLAAHAGLPALPPARYSSVTSTTLLTLPRLSL